MDGHCSSFHNAPPTKVGGIIRRIQSKAEWLRKPLFLERVKRTFSWEVRAIVDVRVKHDSSDDDVRRGTVTRWRLSHTANKLTIYSELLTSVRQAATSHVRLLYGKQITTDTRWFKAISFGEPGLAGFPFDCASPDILFNTIPPCPSHRGEEQEGTTVKEEEWKKIHSMSGSNWCRDFEARCPSCRQPDIYWTSSFLQPSTDLTQPVLKTSTATTSLLRGKVHSMRGNWYRVWCPSCRQPVLKTSNGTHPFFNHQQTPKKRDFTPFYVCSQTSVPLSRIPNHRQKPNTQYTCLPTTATQSIGLHTIHLITLKTKGHMAANMLKTRKHTTAT